MFIGCFRHTIGKVFELFFRLLHNPQRLFLIWIRSISIVTLVLQLQTLSSISTYAFTLHQRRQLLFKQLHINGILFVSTIRRDENQPKSFFHRERKTLKRLRQMCDVNVRSRTRTM